MRPIKEIQLHLQLNNQVVLPEFVSRAICILNSVREAMEPCGNEDMECWVLLASSSDHGFEACLACF